MARLSLGLVVSPVVPPVSATAGRVRWGEGDRCDLWSRHATCSEDVYPVSSPKRGGRVRVACAAKFQTSQLQAPPVGGGGERRRIGSSVAWSRTEVLATSGTDLVQEVASVKRAVAVAAEAAQNSTTATCVMS